MSKAGYTGISVPDGPYSHCSLAGETDGTEAQSPVEEARRYLLSAAVKVSLSQSPITIFVASVCCVYPPLKSLEMKNTQG